MQSDTESTFTTSAMNLTGADMAKRAAIEVYTKTGIKPSQIDVVELHDCFSTNELICPDGLVTIGA